METTIAGEIVTRLRQRDYWHERFEHVAVRTSEQAAAIRDGYTQQQGAKAILIRAKISGVGKRFAMLVVPADRKFDSAKVRQVLGAKDIRFATEDEVAELTGGVKPGGVPPFGNLFGLDVISDPTLYDNETIVFNAGRTTSIAMRSADYRELVQPTVADIRAD